MSDLKTGAERSDPFKPTAAAAEPSVSKEDQARAIYTTWRNTHLNNIAVDAFSRLEAASEHLIAAIKAAL